MIGKLSHLCFGTRRLETMVSFYRETLGFELAHEFLNDGGERYGVFLHVGGGTFLELFNHQSGRSSGGMFRHYCLEVEDLEVTAERLLKKGIHLDIDRGRSDATLRAELIDPDGNVIELHQIDAESALNEYKVSAT